MRLGWAVAALAVTATVCGGGGLSKHDFIAKGDQICADFANAGKKLGDPTRPDQIDSYIAKLIPLVQRARDEFAKLDPSGDARKVRDAMVSALDAFRAKAEEASAAAAKGDLQTMAKLLDEGASAMQRADVASARYGFKVCPRR